MHELTVPPVASETTAVEIVRIWGGPGLPQQSVLRTTWTDPEAWGLLLADLARHAAKAYDREGVPEQIALQKMAQRFALEMTRTIETPR
jgi:hypothetical protein